MNKPLSECTLSEKLVGQAEHLESVCRYDTSMLVLALRLREFAAEAERLEKVAKPPVAGEAAGPKPVSLAAVDFFIGDIAYTQMYVNGKPFYVLKRVDFDARYYSADWSERFRGAPGYFDTKLSLDVVKLGVVAAMRKEREAALAKAAELEESLSRLSPSLLT